MALNVPWWLNPWREAQRQRQGYLEQCGHTERSAALNLRISSELNQANLEIMRLRGQLSAAVTDSKISGSALATNVPEFVLVGIPRGNGKRIQVSRDIEVTAFAMTEPGEGDPRFKIGAIMARLLVIDKPTYAECMAHLATIWANQDRVAQPGARLTPVSGPLKLPTGEA